MCWHMYVSLRTNVLERASVCWYFQWKKYYGGGGIGTRLLRIFRFSEEFGFFREVDGACSLNKSVNLSFTRVMQISRHNIIRSGNFLEFPSSADRFLEKFQKWFNRKKWFKWVDWVLWEFPLNYISFVRSGDFQMISRLMRGVWAGGRGRGNTSKEIIDRWRQAPWLQVDSYCTCLFELRVFRSTDLFVS